MTKKLTLSALLITVAFMLSYIEFLVPLPSSLGVPGIKLGLANIVTLFAIFYPGRRYAVIILLARIFLQSTLFGSVTALIFSLCGGLFSFFIMCLMQIKFDKWFSLIGISIAGSAAHNIGQILAACVYFKTASVICYLPILLMAAVLMGLVTGYIAVLLFKALERSDFKKHNLP